jgi:hypothetical protein
MLWNFKIKKDSETNFLKVREKSGFHLNLGMLKRQQQDVFHPSVENSSDGSADP